MKNIEQHIEPKWLTLEGGVVYSGLSRPLLEVAIREGIIRSSHVRKPGAKRGRRLIERKSLDAWIESGVGEVADLPALQAGNLRKNSAA